MEKTTKLFDAISKFQKECPPIHEGNDTKHYSYASLANILAIINPLMDKHGLGFTQPIDGDSVKTIIFHTSGESIESSIRIPDDVTLTGMNRFQVMGSAITYMRRYMLSSMLGLITEKDTDGNGVDAKAGKDAKEAQANGYKQWQDAINAVPTKTDLVAFYNANKAAVDGDIEIKKMFTVRQEQLKLTK